MRFVIVDDNQVDLLLIARVLYGAFPLVTIVTVADPDRVAEALAGAHLVIADYHLPDMPWPAIVEAVRAHAPGAPIIVVSDMVHDDRGEQAIRDGAADYLPKARLADLPAMARRAMARQEAERAQRAAAVQLLAATQEPKT